MSRNNQSAPTFILVCGATLRIRRIAMLNDLTSNEIDLDGVVFTLAEGFSRRKCIVLRQALYLLSDDTDPQDLNAIYRRHEYRIQQVARRMLNSALGDKPLIIGPWAFRAQAA
jgi:hypothetical protein